MPTPSLQYPGKSDTLKIRHISSRASLGHNEEVHGSRILREWSTIIAYEMGSSPTEGYTMDKTFHVESFKYD